MRTFFKNTVVSKLLSALLHIAVALIALFIVLSLLNLYGKASRYTFLVLFWSLPLALAIAVGGQTLINRYRRFSVLLRTLVTGLCAGLLAFAWEFSLTQLLGPLNVALNLPIVYFWFAAAFIQLSFLDWRLPKQTEKKEAAHILLGFISFPLVAIIALLGLNLLSVAGASLDKPESETYLIPSDFKGEFRVVYDEPGGIDPNYENGRRVLRIPENGILVIQSPFKAGTVDQDFFLVDKKGKRTHINTVGEFKNRLKEAPGVLFWGPANAQASWPVKKANGEKTSAVIYHDFTLYRKNSIERNTEEYTRFQQQFDSLTNAVVVRSRKKLD